MIVCPFRALTGYACPLCGGLRMTDALLHGDLAAAWGHNPLVMTLLGISALLLAARVAGRGPRLRPLLADPRLALGLVAVMTVFAVVRNLPGVSFLGPA
ncbi:DUF2752 domain-containing protein [Nostocoides vanveenii]|uniref:DUF2752 domain-containing protein n=1 Tax=Nostocoides vanveenii TaxID=330835 RepID=A0ABP4X8J5_9MICO